MLDFTPASVKIRVAVSASIDSEFAAESRASRVRGLVLGLGKLSYQTIGLDPGAVERVLRVRKLQLFDQDEVATCRSTGEGSERSRERVREAGPPRNKEGWASEEGGRLTVEIRVSEE